MTRPLPKIIEQPVIARAAFEPNGAHQLTLYVPRLGAEIPLTVDEVTQIEGKIAAFKSESAMEDGRTVERTNTRWVAL